MKNAGISIILLFILAITACSAAGLGIAQPESESAIPAAVPTITPAPSATAASEPSSTPTLAPLQLEIVEWSTWEDVPGYTNVEVLLRNPNDFPVRVNKTKVSVINAAGESVLTTDDVSFYLWGDNWGLILPGETVPATIHVYPASDGEQVPAWKTFSFVSNMEAATPPPYTQDLHVSLGKFHSAIEFDQGADLDITNTSAETLKCVLFRLTARNRDGAYVGVDNYVSMLHRDDAGNLVLIKPGISFHTIFVPELTHVPPESLHYEITAIGLPAQGQSPAC